MSKEIILHMSDDSYVRIKESAELYNMNVESFIHSCISKQLRCIGK